MAKWQTMNGISYKLYECVTGECRYLNCCDCGGSGCGCRYCYSCNCCENCRNQTEVYDDKSKKWVMVVIK